MTARQFVAGLRTTGNKGIINFINAGDFAVSDMYLFINWCASVLDVLCDRVLGNTFILIREELYFQLKSSGYLGFHNKRTKRGVAKE